ncbi:tetratricopeptide repeat protein [Rhodococcus sp. GOMB7]|nr:tetratricopeptide repeat protein [Rhodococcus sp. GOMB7]MBT9299005.1 tetratricopeptide repeat protein [Rhodococcus sp. GOMB7]MCC4306278.1 tetratricopeptide repeat protein [Rhodococcus sp. 3-2]
MPELEQAELSENFRIEAEFAIEDGYKYGEDREYSKAAEKYRHAQELFETCKHLRGQANAGLGLGNALVELQQFDEAISIFEAARIKFANHMPYPIHRGVADCNQQLGVAHRQLGHVDEAITAYRLALGGYPRECESERVSSAIGLSSVVAMTGAYGEALQILRDAERQCSSPIEAIQVAVNIGVFYADSGQYDTACKQLEDARATAVGVHDDKLVAMCDTNLGYVHVHSGRNDDAAAAYKRACNLYEKLAQQANSQDTYRDMKTKVATCRMNLGAVYGSDGDHRRAITTYNEALAMFNQLELPDRIADCQMNLGVEQAALGELPAAKRLYQCAFDYYQSTSGKGRQAAGCRMNLGRLEAAAGHHPEAQSAHRAAGAEFRALGLHEWQARCAVSLASSISVTPESVDTSAIDVLLPALLHLDAVKYQFPTAAARLSWKRTVSEATRLAFELAMEAGDTRLVAELVETTINSGVHTVGQEEASAGTDVDKVAGGRLLRPSRADWTALKNRSAGPTRLVAGVELPMASPPRLRMPSGNIALERFHDIALKYTPSTQGDPVESTIGIVDIR